MVFCTSAYIIIVGSAELPELMNKQFNDSEWSVPNRTKPCTTQPQVNVLSCVLFEYLVEPWHVGVCATGSLATTTLPIPQGVIAIQLLYMTATKMSTRLTVIVTTNKGRNVGLRKLIAWAIGITIPIFLNRSSISPDVFAWSTTICDGYTINIISVNGHIKVTVWIVKKKSYVVTQLISH